MGRDKYTKVVLTAIAALLFLNLMAALFASKPAQAVGEGRGKYQISSWATSIGTYGHHSGYFILDTVSGKVVDSHEEVHDITKDIPKSIPKGQPGEPKSNPY